MQISKLLPTVCAAVFCASFISVRADDTPVQAAARAALEQKMSELDTQQTQAPPFVVTAFRRRGGATKPAHNQYRPRTNTKTGGHGNNAQANPDARCARCA